MKLNKTLAFAVRLARFAEDLGIPVPRAAEMVALANASKRAYERGDTDLENRRADDLAEIARIHGCKVDWPGLWPCVERNGYPKSNQLLPSDD